MGILLESSPTTLSFLLLYRCTVAVSCVTLRIGCTRTDVFLDSKCHKNLVNQKFFKRLHTRLCPLNNDAKLYSASGQTMQALGYVIVLVAINNVIRQTNFLVLDNLHTTCILSLQFLYANGCKFHFDTGVFFLWRICYPFYFFKYSRRSRM